MRKYPRLLPVLAVVVVWAVFALPADAALFSSGSDELQKALTAPDVTVEGYELSRDDLNAFYTARNFRPAWDFTGPDNQAALSAFVDSIEHLVDYHGLQREEYAIELMRKLGASADAQNTQNLELLVTDTLLHLAHDLHGDTLDLADLYPGWKFHRKDINIPATLAAAVAANGLNEYIESLAPENPAYRDLAKALQAYRTIAAKGWGLVDAGPILRPNGHSPRVAQLRARLAAEGYLPQVSLPPKQGEKFDDDLHQALKAYQLRNGLDSDGNLGAKTLSALNVPVARRLDQITANMERWRHMPDDFPPSRYALVNIPDFSIDIVEDGRLLYSGPVVIGQVERKTPFIQSAIRSMIINPIWHVPAKIARKDILPKLRRDPHYLEKLGFVISGSEDDPHGENVDWQSIREREFNFRLRQAPGDMNSLGRLKFDFDNDFAVYMHGTPHQELFDKNQRALSSGCIRLRDPEDVAVIVLAGNKDVWDIERVESEIDAEKTHWIGIAKPLPLFVLYWTVFTGEDGQLNFRNDVYDYDSFLMENMRAQPAPDKLQ